MRLVGDLRLVYAGGSCRRPGRAPSCCFSAFCSSWCSSRSRLLRLCSFLVGGLFLALSLAPVAAMGGLRSYVGPPRVRRSCGLSWKTWSTEFSSVSAWFGFLAVLAVFYVLRGARQVICVKFKKEFVASRFPSWRVASEFFSAFAAPDPGVLRGGGLTRTAQSSGAPGSSADLSF